MDTTKFQNKLHKYIQSHNYNMNQELSSNVLNNVS